MAKAAAKTKKDKGLDMVEADILHFQGLMQHPGWVRLATIIDRNIDLLREQIVEKRANDGSPLTNEQVDRLRDRLTDIREIRNAPETYVRMLTEKGLEAKIDEYDPYEKAGDRPPPD